MPALVASSRVHAISHSLPVQATVGSCSVRVVWATEIPRSSSGEPLAVTRAA